MIVIRVEVEDLLLLLVMSLRFGIDCRVISWVVDAFIDAQAWWLNAGARVVHGCV